MGGSLAILVLVFGGLQTIECPDGTKHMVSNPRRAPCVSMCEGGTWIIEGEECPGRPLPRRAPAVSSPPPLESLEPESTGPSVVIVPGGREERVQRQNERKLREHRRRTTGSSGRSSSAYRGSGGSGSANSNIRTFCERKWSGEFSMQKYCVDKQTEAAVKVNRFLKKHPSGTGRDISARCAIKWTENGLYNYSMISYCIDKEVEAFNALNR